MRCIRFTQFPNVDCVPANQSEIYDVSRIPPVPDNLEPIGSTIPAASGKLTTRDVTRFIRVTRTNETVRCYIAAGRKWRGAAVGRVVPFAQIGF